MLKVCVYAICKNEEDNIDSWYENIKEADSIVLLDTGSTDSTISKIKKYSKIQLYQKIYKDFRFDTARNDCMSYIPEDIDLCVVLDLDERLSSNWYDILRQKDINQIPSRSICSREETDGTLCNSHLYHLNPKKYYFPISWEGYVGESLIYHGAIEKLNYFQVKQTTDIRKIHKSKKSLEKENFYENLYTQYFQDLNQQTISNKENCFLLLFKYQIDIQRLFLQKNLHDIFMKRADEFFTFFSLRNSEFSEKEIFLFLNHFLSFLLTIDYSKHLLSTVFLYITLYIKNYKYSKNVLMEIQEIGVHVSKEIGSLSKNLCIEMFFELLEHLTILFEVI